MGLRTALEWGRQAAGEAPAADSAGEAPASSTAPAPALGPTAIERYLVPLLTDADKPAGAGAVTETSYGQGSGEKYIACAAGTIKNNTSVSAGQRRKVHRLRRRHHQEQHQRLRRRGGG